MYFHKDPDDQSVAISVLNTTPSKTTEDSWHTPSNPYTSITDTMFMGYVDKSEGTDTRKNTVAASNYGGM